MKKKILTAAIALLTTVCMLAMMHVTTGCSLLRLLLDNYDPYARTTVKLDDMVYTRPDTDELINLIKEKTAMIDGSDGKTYSSGQRDQGIVEVFNAFYEWQSMETLSYVRFSIDTTDSKWAAETEFFDKNSPKVRQELENLYVACARSEYKEELESQLFGEGTLDEYVDGGILTDEISALMQEESLLVTRFYEYDYMNAVFEIDGIRGTIEDHARNAFTDSDYDRIYDAFYKKVNEETGPILIDLVKIRKQISDLAGYGSYAEFAFDYVLRRDYTPEQAGKLVENIKSKFVPVYLEATGNGLSDIFYDISNYSISYGLTFDAVESAIGGADERFAKVFEFMQKYDLCWLGYESSQMSASYTTYIQKYNAPVTVILGDGNVSDVLTLAHEFGHFTDGYMNYGGINDLDLSEIASTTLEYLLLSRLDQTGLSSRDTEALRQYSKASTFDLFISQCLYYTFEERLYQLPEDQLTLEGVNALASSVARDFGVEDEYEYFGYNWSMIEHFYQQPFYVISYVTASSVSIQIAAKGFNKAGSGLETYFELINWNYDNTFSENIERAGLKSPFSDGAVDDLINKINLVFGQ